MRYSSRFFLYAPFAGLLLLAAIAMVHWWIVAGALAKRLDSMNGREIMPGVHVSFTQKRIAGFPFRTDTMLKNLRVEVAEVDGPLVWTSENFAMHELTYGRVQAIFEAAGRQTLSWTDAHGAAHRFGFLPGTFRASSILQGGRLMRFDAQIIDLDGAEFRASEAQLHIRATKAGIDLYLSLQHALVRGGYLAPLGPEIANLVVNGTLDHAGPLQTMLRGSLSPRNALEAWRQAGGVLSAKDFRFTSRDTATTLLGRLALDSHHDLIGVLAGGSPDTGRFGVLNFAGNRLIASGLSRP
jgi:hypothetical protein